MRRCVIRRLIGHLAPRHCHPALPHKIVVEPRQARKKVVRHIPIIAILHLRNGRLHQHFHRRRQPHHRSDRQSAKVIDLPFMLGEHHADVPIQQGARAVKQMLAPSLRIIPAVAHLAHQPNHLRNIVQRHIHLAFDHPAI